MEGKKKIIQVNVSLKPRFFQTGSDGALKEKVSLRTKTERRVTATGPLAELVVSGLSCGHQAAAVAPGYC